MRDLVVPDNVTVLTDGDVVVVKVASPRVGRGRAPTAAAAAEGEAPDDADAEEAPPSGRTEQEPDVEPGESGA